MRPSPSDPLLQGRVRVALALDSGAEVRVTEWVMLDSRSDSPHRVEIEVRGAGKSVLLTFDEASEKLSVATLRAALPPQDAVSQVTCI
jgi:anti-sigma-K factor RskA